MSEAEVREALANARRAWNALGYLSLHLDVLEHDHVEFEQAHYDPEDNSYENYLRQYAARMRLKGFMGEVIQDLGTRLGHPPEEIHEWFDPEKDDWFDREDEGGWFGYDPEGVEERLETADEDGSG